jgi:excinuclease ABC subunit C
MDIKEKVKNFPDSPGVYLMKDASGKIIYIGKAISLKKRVRSYFQRSRNRDPKINLLLSNIRDIDFVKTKSEAQALILEAGLIKKNYPRYNIELRDDKSYPFIKVTHEEFPTIMIVRPRKKDNAEYFGAYTSASLLREALKIIRRVFPFRTCKISKKKKACLDYHLGLCPGVCIGKISPQDYQKNIQNIRMILEGKQTELLDNLYKEMKLASSEKRFEDAASIRDQIEALSSLYFEGRSRSYFSQAQELKENLKLAKLPKRIEAFDISNIFGKQAVGSMVSFLKGKPDKNNYRRFKIKTVSQPDDYKMLSEIIFRRYWRLKKENKKLPDLIVIDGGKGQLSAVKNELDLLAVKVPVIAIAKENEEIFLPDKSEPIKLAFESAGLQLIQRVRDEAHRFAVKYHRLLRKKKTLGEG